MFYTNINAILTFKSIYAIILQKIQAGTTAVLQSLPLYTFYKMPYFKIATASLIVFSKASLPYLSTSALFFSP